MLRHVIAFSLKNSAVVLLLAVLLVVYAAARLPRVPVDVFPELNAEEYRKFEADTGWVDFVEDTNNSIESAAGSSGTGSDRA